MIGLRTARVVVIDDDREEAWPLLDALNRIRITALYFNGDAEALPEKPLDGIRVVFLDLRLMSSPTAQPKQYIQHALSILSRIINEESFLTGIVYWTKYDEDKTEFERQLAARMPRFKPAFLLSISNKRKLCEAQNVRELKNAITKELKKIPGQQILWKWEQAIHQGATEASAQIANVAMTDNDGGSHGDIDKGILDILSALTLSAGGGLDDSRHTVTGFLYEGLNQIHFDRLEQLLDNPTRRAEFCVDKNVKKQLTSSSACSDLKKRQLNSILLISGMTPSISRVSPGNMYISKIWDGKVEPFPFDKRKVSYKTFISELWSNNIKPDFLRDLKKKSTPCLLDITPPCDYANRKIKYARLVGGVILRSNGNVEDDKKCRLPIQSREFAKEIEWCMLQKGAWGAEGNYKIVVNARYLFSIPVEKLRKQKPAIRLRQQVVTDIQAWFASHAARPGYLSVH